jgi:chemotaxis family two-component system response regulator Rcp1
MLERSTPRSLHGRFNRPGHILLVEDCASDVRMIVNILRQRSDTSEIHSVVDGEEAMAFLRGQGRYAGAPRPDLIILDLNLPRRDGREVLAEVKADDDLKVIPVVVFTTSTSDVDIAGSYRLHANSYVAKPVGFDDFVGAVRGIEDFWLSLVRLPGGVRL